MDENVRAALKPPERRDHYIIAVDPSMDRHDPQYAIVVSLGDGEMHVHHNVRGFTAAEGKKLHPFVGTGFDVPMKAAQGCACKLAHEHEGECPSRYADMVKAVDARVGISEPGWDNLDCACRRTHDGECPNCFVQTASTKEAPSGFLSENGYGGTDWASLTDRLAKMAAGPELMWATRPGSFKVEAVSACSGAPISQKETPMQKIEVTADTPVRVVYEQGGEGLSLTIDDIEPDEITPQSAEFIRWIIHTFDATAEGYYRFGDVWNKCPKPGWLGCLLDCIGFRASQANSYRRSADSSDAKDRYEAKVAVARQEQMDAECESIRVYQSPFEEVTEDATTS